MRAKREGPLLGWVVLLALLLPFFSSIVRAGEKAAFYEAKTKEDLSDEYQKFVDIKNGKVVLEINESSKFKPIELYSANEDKLSFNVKQTAADDCEGSIEYGSCREVSMNWSFGGRSFSVGNHVINDLKPGKRIEVDFKKEEMKGKVHLNGRCLGNICEVEASPSDFKEQPYKITFDAKPGCDVEFEFDSEYKLRAEPTTTVPPTTEKPSTATTATIEPCTAYETEYVTTDTPFVGSTPFWISIFAFVVVALLVLVSIGLAVWYFCFKKRDEPDDHEMMSTKDEPSLDLVVCQSPSKPKGEKKGAKPKAKAMEPSSGVEQNKKAGAKAPEAKQEPKKEAEPAPAKVPEPAKPVK